MLYIIVSSLWLDKHTVKPVLSSHTREAQKVAALGRWLLNRGEYQYKFNIWEHFVWLLKTGCCLREVTTNTGLTVICDSLKCFTVKFYSVEHMPVCSLGLITCDFYAPRNTAKTNWCIDNPFVGPSEMTFCLTKCGKLPFVIMHYIMLANQKTESFVYSWLQAQAIFDVMGFSMFVGTIWRHFKHFVDMLTVNVFCEFWLKCWTLKMPV